MNVFVCRIQNYLKYILMCLWVSACQSGDEMCHFKLSSFPVTDTLAGKAVHLPIEEPYVPGALKTAGDGYLVYLYDADSFLVYVNDTWEEACRVAPKGEGPGEGLGVSRGDFQYGLVCCGAEEHHVQEWTSGEEVEKLKGIRSAYTSLRDLSYDVEHEVMAEIYGSCPFVIHDLSDSGIPMRLTYDIGMSLIPPLGREPFADSEFCAYLCTRYIMTGAVPQACSLAGRRVCPPPETTTRQ